MVYYVVVQEVYDVIYRVEADSKEHAIQKFNDSEYPELDFGEPEMVLDSVSDVTEVYTREKQDV